MYSTACSIAMLLALSWCVTESLQLNSALYDIKKDYRLTDFLIKSQRLNGIQTCAHFCSINTECRSINFKTTTGKQGLCELNSKSAVQDDRPLRNSPGWSFAYLVKQTEDVIQTFNKTKQPEFMATFTSLGAQGHKGPILTDGYTGTPLQGKVVLKSGIQFWKVPYTGDYVIVAIGASGGNGTNGTAGAGWRLGGRGAKIKGKFHLKAETELKILVGQQGGVTTIYQERPGGGGGGTFVTTKENVVLLIAGGGGGGASIFPRGDCRDGDPGQSTENGTRYGGKNGSGGNRYDKVAGLNPRSFEGTGGGGFNGDGASSSITCFGGTAFIRGGSGGVNNAKASNGGFGGGGAGTQYPGGGGGYSGGGVMGDRKLFAVAGGGGSINKGTEQDNESGVNLGDGKVFIRLVR